MTLHGEVHGRGDRIPRIHGLGVARNQPAAPAYVRKVLAKSRVEILTNCGHWSPLEAPIAVAELVRAQVSNPYRWQPETVQKHSKAACLF